MCIACNCSPARVKSIDLLGTVSLEYSPDVRKQIYSRPNTTLLVVVTKNAFDWIISMRKLPYHAPMHSFDFKNYSAFIRRPWALVDTFEQVVPNP